VTFAIFFFAWDSFAGADFVVLVLVAGFLTLLVSVDWFLRGRPGRPVFFAVEASVVAALTGLPRFLVPAGGAAATLLVVLVVVILGFAAADLAAGAGWTRGAIVVEALNNV
jgi:hypothetical protein